MAFCALATATGALAEPKDLATATPLAAAAQVPCTVTDARFAFEGALSDGTAIKTYEVACQEGLGYVLIAKTKGNAPPQAVDCFSASQPTAPGKPNPLACKLPANANPTAGLQLLASKAGSNCQLDKARAIGASPDKNYFELACKNGQGWILGAPLKAGGGAPLLDNCLDPDTSNTLKCTLTTKEQELSIVEPLVAASGKPCTVKDKRYVMTSTSGDTYYEVACTSGKGFMIGANGAGAVQQAIDCAQAGGIDQGCTLTDARQAQTEESALYSRLAKKAGFDCQVAQYAVFPSQAANKEVVELKCANRPDGGVGIFPANGAPEVFDCLRSQNRGYRCSMTPESALYPKLTAQLRARNKPSCVVSGAVAFGVTTASTDLIEVACADGGPGWVIEYPSSAQQPIGLLTCGGALARGNGGCKLPSNHKD
jgi:hypothetical protein